jgi:hypothetical protein
MVSKKIIMEKGIKRLIVNGQDGIFNIIVLSSEKSTDPNGEYIRLDLDDLIKLYEGIGDMIDVGEVVEE